MLPNKFVSLLIVIVRVSFLSIKADCEIIKPISAYLKCYCVTSFVLVMQAGLTLN